MGVLMMAFAAIFSVLAGWAASILFWGRRGWLFVLLGLIACYVMMAAIMFLQLTMLDMIGVEKTAKVIRQSTFILAGATCFIWAPSFLIFYSKNSGSIDK